MKKVIVVIVTLLFIFLNDILFDKIINKRKTIQITFMKNLIKLVIFMFGIYYFGNQFDKTKDIGNKLLQSTSLVVAILGFAAQSVLADIIAGIMISFSKPFNIGERITLKNNNIVGIVEDITLRHTVIKCFNGVRTIIPNSIINKELIQNSDFNSDEAGNYFEIELPIDIDNDVNHIIENVKNVINNNELVLNKEDNLVYVSKITKESIFIKTTIWTKNIDDNFKACSDIRIKLLELYKENRKEKNE